MLSQAAAVVESASTSKPITSLEQLLRDRAGLHEELSGLQASSARLKETTASEAAALGEIAELGKAEIAAMTEWAASGCRGDPPVPDQRRRKVLAEKLATAQTAAAAATAAGQDIDARITEANQRIHAMDAEIERAVFNKVEAEHAALLTELAEVAETGSQLVAKIIGLARYYNNLGAARRESGDQDGGVTLHQRGTMLGGKLPVMGASQKEIEHAALEWGRRIDTLRRGV